jgi:hypothetical protein
MDAAPMPRLKTGAAQLKVGRKLWARRVFRPTGRVLRFAQPHWLSAIDYWLLRSELQASLQLQRLPKSKVQPASPGQRVLSICEGINPVEC